VTFVQLTENVREASWPWPEINNGTLAMTMDKWKL
jgi:hypothetical protein